MHQKYQDHTHDGSSEVHHDVLHFETLPCPKLGSSRWLHSNATRQWMMTQLGHMVNPKLAQAAKLLCCWREAGDRQRSCCILSRLPLFGVRLRSVHLCTYCSSTVKSNSCTKSESKSHGNL